MATASGAARTVNRVMAKPICRIVACKIFGYWQSALLRPDQAISDDAPTIEPLLRLVWRVQA
jgi:hypothetical protein